MKRNMNKAIAEFKKLEDQRKVGTFYAHDLIGIDEMSRDKYECIINGLRAGYMIGYKAAMRDVKKAEEGTLCDRCEIAQNSKTQKELDDYCRKCSIASHIEGRC